jgi:ubiquinone/menaquinone biosynthesis C-methylase UbiE
MGTVDYDERQHAGYAAGRKMSATALATWMEAFRRHLPEARPLTWLDLGSGTGRMTPCLASVFGGPVHGVEPSEKMRARAVADASHPAVSYAAGSAERIPLPDASCDAALVFYVWHHVVDREAAAQELRRVVKPGGKLFVQANFSDRMPDVWWLRVVPEWREADTAQFRSQDEVTRDFTSTGWTLLARDEVTWLRGASLTEEFDRLKLRSVSLFEHVTDEVIDAGFATIEATLPSLGDEPQYETSQLLVLQR